ncbi:MAG: UDP-N-acetylmuramoyl-L-alanyl-D-glutamate--2,6-diaminopimelate ligase [Actinobacteria bacterium]|nr:MAG: UDP-N-acetylmuramoyl-L-alanyl-D-glutamate--2,6-diaminopimelate ligase [Actinomycetota bacterium]
MKLVRLIQDITKVNITSPDIEITGIAYDSRKVKPGDLFVCIKGAIFDGHRYLLEAKERGALAAVVEDYRDLDIIQVKVDNARLALAKLANRFYDFPSKKLILIGITGTNGKTTTSYLVREIFKEAGFKTGLIGTIEYIIGDTGYPVVHTTPESADLQKLLKSMVDNKVQVAVMEVSSHAICMQRINGTKFSAMVFTNLSQDHLDFHKDMESYFRAKLKLFSKSHGQQDHINVDDLYGQKLAQISKNPQINYSITNNAEVLAKEINLSPHKTSFKLCFGGQEVLISNNLVGNFNVYNCLAASACAISQKVSLNSIKKGLELLKSVPGRFESIKEGQDFSVIVDYAHTPDGLEKILDTAKQTTNGRIILVFGAGGDRDKAKREVMGRVACQKSDMSIITSDNPRSEDKEDIIKDIVKGFENNNYQIEPDRRKAIRKALDAAKAEDVVIIAGKGHEQYQIFKDKTVHFSDQEEAREYLKSR